MVKVLKCGFKEYEFKSHYFPFSKLYFNIFLKEDSLIGKVTVSKTVYIGSKPILLVLLLKFIKQKYMPQLDWYSFSVQIFWVLFSFIIFFFFFLRYFLCLCSEIIKFNFKFYNLVF